MMNKFRNCLLFSFVVVTLFTTSAVALAQTGGSATSLLNLEANIFWLLISAFGIGVVLTFTPCVLPMIPIVSAIIVSQEDAPKSSIRGGILSIVYVLGTVATYAMIGAVAGATGDQLQAYFQKPWLLSLLAVILMAGSLSLFGLYELRLPSQLETKIQTSANRIRARSVSAVFFLGLVSALIVGACVTPLLISVLGVVIAEGDPLLGAATMSAMALGMGVILIAIGFGLSFFVPKTGVWMERTNHLLGVALIAVAIYLLGSIPEFPVLFFWAALFVVIAVYLGTLQKLRPNSDGWRLLCKGAGIAFFVWGITSFTGSALGNRDLANPLPQLNSLMNINKSGIAQTADSKQSIFVYARNMDEFESMLVDAKSSNRAVLVDFYADWCLDCVRMDRTTFKDPTMIAYINEHVSPIKIDVTDPKDEFGRSIRKRFSVFGPPAIVLYDKQGIERPDLLTYGYLDVEELTELLNGVL